MGSIVALLKRRSTLAVLVALLVVGGGVLWWTSGDEKADPLASGSRETPSETPSTDSDDEKKDDDKSDDDERSTGANPTCEGPDTVFNIEGEQVDSLLPDCGEEPVTTAQQKKKGLGLGCGGKYPIILYKTQTDDMKSSICGVNSSGEKLRVVVQTADGDVKDLSGSYEYQVDGFVAKDGKTTYVVQAYDGTIVTRAPSGTTQQTSDDWISLDNEPDYD